MDRHKKFIVPFSLLDKKRNRSINEPNLTLYYNNGCKYEGELNKDLSPCGKGKIKFSNGDQYIGTLKNGKMHGKGEYSTVFGLTSFGRFKKNKPTGRHFIYFKNVMLCSSYLPNNLFFNKN